jgi:hypothetical protein
MTLIEAAVWMVGIISVCTTITTIAKSFSKANNTTADVREWLESEHQKHIEAQMDWERQNVRENDSEDR